MIALAASNRKLDETGVQQLPLWRSDFLFTFVSCNPEYDAIRTTYFINAYIDMAVHSPQQGLWFLILIA